MEDHNFTISGYKFILNLSTRFWSTFIKFLNVDQFAEWGIQMQHNSGIQIQISKTPCVDNTKMKFWQTNKNILENESNMTAQLCPLRYLSLYNHYNFHWEKKNFVKKMSILTINDTRLKHGHLAITNWHTT